MEIIVIIVVFLLLYIPCQMVKNAKIFDQIDELKARIDDLEAQLNIVKNADFAPHSIAENAREKYGEVVSSPMESEISSLVHSEPSNKSQNETPPTSQSAVKISGVSEPVSNPVKEEIREDSPWVKSEVKISEVSKPTLNHAERQVIHEEKTEDILPKEEKSNPILAWLLKGNPIVKVGAVILFLGLSFLLRLASEYISFSIENRYASVAVIGVISTVLGWRLRYRRYDYALILQGLGIGILYLTSLSALKFHQLLPASVVFSTQVLLVITMVGLALLQNSRLLAQVALLGGLASPVLVSDGSGNYLVLFCYLALLNTGVAFVAWFKAWRSLNLISFVGSTALILGWGWKYYTPELYLICQLFLVYYIVLYTFIVCRFAILQTQSQEGFSAESDDNATLKQLWLTWLSGMRRVGSLDGSLLFGSALTAFGMQYSLVETFPQSLMYSAFAFALFYTVCGVVMTKRSALGVVAQGMYLLGLVFFTLGLGNIFNETLNRFFLLGIEGTLLYVFGVKQKMPFVRLNGVALSLTALLCQLFYAPFDAVISSALLLQGLVIPLMWAHHRKLHSALWETRGVMGITGLLLYGVVWYFAQLYAHGYLSYQSVVIFIVVLALLGAFWQWRKSNLLLTFWVSMSFLFPFFIHLFGGQMENSPRLFESDFAQFVVLLAFRFDWLFKISIGEFYQWLDTLPLWLNGVLAISAFIVGWLVSNPKTSVLRIHNLGGWANLIYSGITLWFLLDDYLDLYSSVRGAVNILIIFGVGILLTPWLRWKQLAQTQVAFLPIFACYSLLLFLEGINRHLLEYFFILLIATILHIATMPNWKTTLKAKLQKVWHVGGLNFFILAWSVYFVEWVDSMDYTLSKTWFETSKVVVPLIVDFALLKLRPTLQKWGMEKVYLKQGVILSIIFLFIAFLVGLGESGDPSPWRYIPVLNPLEFCSLGILVLLWLWHKSVSQEKIKTEFFLIIGAAGWLLLNVMLMRLWYFYGDIPWNLDAMLRSFGLQASLSILWTLCAITLMVKGNRLAYRKSWLIGAGLISLVVVKLFTVELSNSGGIARIVSFIVVGGLLLAVGYFAPLPAKNQNEK
ncbi:hypothetical protein BKK51_04205 [Rodentibacter trehalosifermentans]|uniref:DUF2339 domain-containing protein n=1 Tax=Rodentibacter trehalosifermentans TaxID=1908263 RepID=A0A1V3IUE5_9PAST|nr:DUF2339 domain-containing protein [Rodentibacter trehalosifermentans]OOF45564.1 hypothetical protein BKK52_12395 [Rodentibacter trehalosifermentans]OOF46062.1 hypothetical protein BKK51_04205 [Rodentibacter trehalosifermentans]